MHNQLRLSLAQRLSLRAAAAIGTSRVTTPASRQRVGGLAARLTAYAFAAAMSTFVLAAPAVAAAQAPPAMVIVVRHAEKADNSADPVLSAEGTARAEAIAQALTNAGVEHVIVTARQRTRLTAEPTMQARGLTAEVVGFGRDMTEHVADLAAAVRRQSGKVVLVVGHSNTVPSIVHALGGPELPDLCETRYASMFTVIPGPVGSPAHVVLSTVGAADPPGADQCPGMSPR